MMRGELELFDSEVTGPVRMLLWDTDNEYDPN